MRPQIRRIAEIGILVLIAAVSILIFIYRDRLQNVGEIGYVGLFVLCFLANATVFLPAPSLMIAASAALILPPLPVALVAALGSSMGEFVGYLCGHTGRDLSPKFSALLDRINAKVKSPLPVVFVLALLPLPLFDVAGVYSGGAKMHLFKFFLCCYAGKFLKTLVYTQAYAILDWATSMIPVL